MNKNNISIISFDVEGTLVTTDFSAAIWFEGIPEGYAKKHGLSFEQAKETVIGEYGKVGDQRIEWYDINYWTNKFGLGSSYNLLERYRHKIQLYPEVFDVLESLSKEYRLIVASGTPREFLVHLLKDIDKYFVEIFSSTSDFQSTKNTVFYNGICAKMKTAPHQILHVGDNLQFDFHEPSQAGLKAYYLKRAGLQDNQDAIQSLVEIKELLLCSC